MNIVLLLLLLLLLHLLLTLAGWLQFVQSATADSSEFYIAVLFVVTICSLGNRPQGTKLTYGAAIIPTAPALRHELDFVASGGSSLAHCTAAAAADTILQLPTITSTA